MHSKRQFLATSAALAAGSLLPGLAGAQGSFPSRPIRIVVPNAAGGGADLTARAVGQAIAGPLGQAVVIDNKPSAGGIVAGETVARAEADGHTLLLISSGSAVSAALFKTLPFDTMKDFAPISLLATFDLVIAVAENGRFKTLADMVSWAKANPGKLSYGSPGLGTPHHLATELLAQKMGVKMTHAPYRGAGPAMLDVIGGQIPFMLVDSAAGLPHINAGKVRAIGVASAQRLKSLPRTPTLIEQGVAGFEAFAWQGLVAPRGTDDATIQAWSKTLQETLKTPAVQARFEALALEPLPSTPEQMREFWLAEKKRWGEVIRTAGITLD